MAFNDRPARTHEAGDLTEKAISKARGRQDRSGQEKTIDLDKLKAAMPQLKKLHGEAKEASKAFSDKVKAIAESSGLLASVVRRFSVASAGDKDQMQEKKKEVEQLELVFGKVK